MQRISIGLLTATLATLGYGSYVLSTAAVAPTVQIVGGNVARLGSTPFNQPITHEFKIINPHPFAIGLFAPQAGCACTTATASASSIPAHGLARVVLHIDPEDGAVGGSASIVTVHGKLSTETRLFVTAIMSGAPGNRRARQWRHLEGH